MLTVDQYEAEWREKKRQRAAMAAEEEEKEQLKAVRMPLNPPSFE